MVSAGIDIGSRTIKFVILENKKIVDYRITDTTVEPLKRVEEILKDKKFESMVATGYGRYLMQDRYNCEIVTEIKAYAIGTSFLYPDCRTIIDIGGQDTKVIKVKDGNVIDFEMNDRCAAGTGKFLEVMAQTLGYTIEEFGSIALKGRNSIPINSMCTVFAESEVISLIARGEDKKDIALSLHHSIINRVMTMVSRMNPEEKVVFAGGVAKNRCMVELLGKKLGNILVPEEPQIIGALGAAIIAEGNLKSITAKERR
ncbi:MAG: acyl-CoA dehydratase activase [candidate division WOR-3 bacterium]|nr:acyl-CoA dehydratase activase [candidate division WOR-3 bacterium]